MKRVLTIVFAVSLSMGQAMAQQAAPRGAAAPAARGAGGAAPRGGGGRGAAAGRILSFEANPASIKAGESFVLTWSTEASSGFSTGSIDNGVGAVSPRGSIKITPKATTTYTLSVGAVTKTVTVTVAGTTAGAAPNLAAGPKAISRIDGKPNFTAVYASSFSGATVRGGTAAPAPPSPFSNLPAQPTLKTGVSNRGAAANPAGGYADCMPLPADTAFGVPYPFQIIQSKDYLMFFFEYPGTFRIIPLDGQPHPAEPDPTWMGDSIGQWEGDTLVIDTVGFNGKHSIGGIQQPSEKFHTIERLTHLSPTSVFYEIIFEDPEFATAKWRATRTFNIDARTGMNKIMEFVCENNRDYKPLFGPDGPPAAQPGGRGGRGGH